MHAIAFDEARPVTEIRPGLPPDLQRVVSRCLRKQPEDRYQSAREFVDDLRRLRSDTESGTIRALPLSRRLQNRFDDLRRAGRSNAMLTAAGVALVAVIVGLIAFDKIKLSSLFFFALLGLFVYRRIRNRRQRMVSRAVARLRKKRDVRLVALYDDTFTVVVDEVSAKLYSQVHGMVDAVNRGLVSGKPVTSAVRDDVQPPELAQMLQRPGVQYVRDDVAKLARTSSLPPAK
jgi:hypothetical protein